MTFVGVQAGQGRAKLGLTGGNLAPRVISVEPAGAKVALVGTTALLLGGDAVELELRVGPGAWLEIVETAGTVVYDADGALSTWTVDVVVEDGGLLLWQGEPFVVAHGANTVRSSMFQLGDAAALCLRETVVLGRTGETGGALRLRNSIRRGETPLLVEDLDLACRQTRELPGVVGANTVIDTVTLIGSQRPELPELTTGNLFALDSVDCSIGRVLRTDLAGSPGSDWWTSWSAAARVAHRGLAG